VTPLALAILFAGLSFAATRTSRALCRNLVPFSDGPRAAKPPTLAFVGLAACLGGALGARHASVQELALAGLLTAALVACCYSDIAFGVVPDSFTLLPLAAVIALSAYERDARPALSALVVCVPFALAAYFSGGRGMGWGDVKLVTLAGAILGSQASFVAFSGACLVAAGTAFVCRRRSEPIAFVPYLAGSAALALTLPHSL